MTCAARLGGLGGWLFHRSPRWGAGFSCSLAGPLAWWQSCLAACGTRRAFGFRSASLLEHLGGSDCARVIIAFLIHLLSAGFVLRVLRTRAWQIFLFFVLLRLARGGLRRDKFFKEIRFGWRRNLELHFFGRQAHQGRSEKRRRRL
jgi:hypothetical protein